MANKSTKMFARRYANGETKITANGAPKRAMTTQRTKPTCTHITMARLRGNHNCDQCGRPSQYGWLYVCAQDTPQPETSPPATPVDSVRSEDIMSDDIKDVHHELAALGISASIITQIKAGAYTPEQIETIKEQKRKLHKTIAEATSLSRSNSHMSAAKSTDAEKRNRYSMAVPSKKDATPSNPNLPTPGNGSTSSPQSIKVLPTITGPPCRFKCCQRCRSFLRERLPMSVETALKSEVPPVTLEEASKLPIMDANLAKTIGMRGSPPPPKRISSLDTLIKALYPQEVKSRSPSGETSPTDTLSSTSDFFDDDEKDNVDVIEEDDVDQKLREAIMGCQKLSHDSTADLSMRKLRRISGSVNSSPSRKVSTPRSLSTSSSASMAASPSTACTTPGIDSEENNSTDSFASGMEVEGGVASKEEAVEIQMPDIMTQI